MENQKELNNFNKLILDIKSNLNLVFQINSKIIQLLSEEENNINQESLNQMVNTRNFLIEKSVNIIDKDDEIKYHLKNDLKKEAKDKIENILSEIDEQEKIIKQLFDKQLNILRTDIIKISQKKNIKIYENN